MDKWQILDELNRLKIKESIPNLSWSNDLLECVKYSLPYCFEKLTRNETSDFTHITEKVSIDELIFLATNSNKKYLYYNGNINIDREKLKVIEDFFQRNIVISYQKLIQKMELTADIILMCNSFKRLFNSLSKETDKQILVTIDEEISSNFPLLFTKLVFCDYSSECKRFLNYFNANNEKSVEILNNLVMKLNTIVNTSKKFELVKANESLNDNEKIVKITGVGYFVEINEQFFKSINQTYTLIEQIYKELSIAFDSSYAIKEIMHSINEPYFLVDNFLLSFMTNSEYDLSYLPNYKEVVKLNSQMVRETTTEKNTLLKDLSRLEKQLTSTQFQSQDL